jgi:hypothetical protein
MERSDLLLQIYQILPKLIDKAISLPDVKLSNSDDPIEESGQPAVRANVRQSVQEWGQLYNLLKEKLGDWDRYWQVFDPTEDDEAIFGTLADDIADVYRDLKEGLVLIEEHEAPPEKIIWNWRLLFYSHWGKHAMDALLAIHFRLQSTLSLPVLPEFADSLLSISFARRNRDSEFRHVAPTAVDRGFRENTRSLPGRQFRRGRKVRKEIYAGARDEHLEKLSGTGGDFPANGGR